MKAVELRSKSRLELETLLGERMLDRERLETGLAAGRVKNVREVRWVKRDIARIRTILRAPRPERPGQAAASYSAKRSAAATTAISPNRSGPTA